MRQIRDGINTEHKAESHPTIFHEVLDNSELPEGDEAQLIVAAGLITTSWVLSVASYHLAAQPKLAARLRAELAAVNAPQPYDWRQLEKAARVSHLQSFISSSQSSTRASSSSFSERTTRTSRWPMLISFHTQDRNRREFVPR